MHLVHAKSALRSREQRYRSPSQVKNSADFVDQIRQTSLEETDVMASFDEASLFTRVPVNEAL